MDLEQQFTIPPQVYEQYEQQHNFYFDKAAETALFEGEVMPMVVLNKGPDLYFFPMLFENEAEKEKSLVMVKCIAHKLKSTHAYFFIEAWFSSQQGVQPSKADDRRESVMCVLWVKDIGGAMLTGEMIRDASGNLIEVKKRDGVSSICGGMFTHLCGENLPKKIRNMLKHTELDQLFDCESIVQKKYKDKFKH